jgi:hypothetical protein
VACVIVIAPIRNGGGRSNVQARSIGCAHLNSLPNSNLQWGYNYDYNPNPR